MEEFNYQKYFQNYQKEHYKAFKVNLKIEEMKELELLLKKLGLTKAQFLRDSIDKLKELDN